MAFSWARNTMISPSSSITSLGENSRLSMLILPASILDTSRMSLRIVSSDSELWRIVCAYSRWMSSKGVSKRRPVMPITPFIGVRTSWLTLARNADLAWLAASATSLAILRSSSIWCRSSISCSRARFCSKNESIMRASRPNSEGDRLSLATVRPSSVLRYDEIWLKGVLTQLIRSPKSIRSITATKHTIPTIMR